MGIYYYDVNSLYPFVMEQYELPGGDPTYYFPSDSVEFEEFKRELTYQPYVEELTPAVVNELIAGLCEQRESVFGFLDVCVIPPQDLLYPVLPERRTVGSTHKNFFCLRNKRGVYFSEELKLAVRKGYVVTEVFGYSKWERERVYKNFITDLKRLKLKGEGRDANGVVDEALGKNKSLRAAAKLMQNSSFGKTIQRFHKERVEIVDNYDRLWKSLKDSKEFKILPLFSFMDRVVVEVTTEASDGVNDKSCCAVGSAILACARMELYSYFEWCEGNGATVLYCDTDSIVYCGPKPLPETMMDDVVYGKMKLEIPTEEIEVNGFVALSPKCYGFNLKDGTPYVKCKGVNTGDNLLSMGEYENQKEGMAMEEDTANLLGQVYTRRGFEGMNFHTLLHMVKGEVAHCYSEQMMFLKHKSRNISRVQMRKVLSDTFDKRRVCVNGNTFAWSNCNITTYLLQGDVTMCSNFLCYASVSEIVNFIVECGGISGELFHNFLPIYESWRDGEASDKVDRVEAAYNFYF